LNQVRWLLTAVVAAYACHLAVHHATPIDRALPFVAAIVTLVAAVSYPSLMLAVPLLVVAEIAIPNEGTRLLALGVVVAGVFGTAQMEWPSPLRRGEKVPKADEGPLLLATAAILLLRWIPFSDVHLGRELFLLAVAALIVLILDRTPFAVAIAVIVVLITPAIPLRTLLLPVAVLLVAILAKLFGMPKVRLAWPSTIVLAFVMLFFAWSGVVARAFPYFLKPARAEVPRHTIAYALPAAETRLLAVPDGATSLIVSGANVAHMTRGTLLGTIDARPIRIGDAADWGYLRRDHFYGTRNPLPADPAGKLRGYGYAAWVDGAGRVPLTPRARVIRVTADAALPAGASLQVEGFE
jgi:hypothetical protein